MLRKTIKAVLFATIGVMIGFFIGWLMGVGAGAGAGSESGMTTNNNLAVESVQAKSPAAIDGQAPATGPAAPQTTLQTDSANPQPQSGEAARQDTDSSTRTARISRGDDDSRIFEYRDLFVEEKQKEIEQRIDELATTRVNEELQRRLESQDQSNIAEREERAKRVDKLLVAAEDAMSREAFHRPPGNNALHFYREALLIEPTEQRAFDGIDKISERFVEKAEFFLSADDLGAARAAADLALAAQTNNARAVDVLKAVDKLEQEGEGIKSDLAIERDAIANELELLKDQLREQEVISGVARETEAAVKRVLVAANTALQEGRLIQPENDSAYYYFTRAISIDDSSVEARSGLEEIRNRLLRSGTQFVKAGNFSSARARVNDLNLVDPSGTMATLLSQVIIANESGPQIQTSNIAPDQAELARKLREAETRAADAELALRLLESSGASAAASSRTTDLGLLEGIADYDSGRYDEAYRKLEELSRIDDPRAAFQISLMEYHGRGVEVNRDQALARMVRIEPEVRRAAESGQAWAQFNVGLMYENGWIVQRDVQEAIDWYRKSAQQGYGAAFNNLGVLYEQGTGVERDRSRAVAFLRRAAEQGNAVARENLAQLGLN